MQVFSEKVYTKHLYIGMQVFCGTEKLGIV